MNETTNQDGREWCDDCLGVIAVPPEDEGLVSRGCICDDDGPVQ